MDPVCQKPGTLVSHTEVISCPGKRKHATTVYHVVWAELLEDMITVSFVEKKKKTSTVYIRGRLLGSTKEEAAEWVEDLLGVAYKGVICISLVNRLDLRNFARYQAEKEVEGIRESVLWPGEVSAPFLPERVAIHLWRWC